jgi:hypothetical protein
VQPQATQATQLSRSQRPPCEVTKPLRHAQGYLFSKLPAKNTPDLTFGSIKSIDAQPGSYSAHEGSPPLSGKY